MPQETPKKRKRIPPENRRFAVYSRRLRDLREDHGLNQEDVGRYLGVSQRAYGDYELGNTHIDIEDLVKLASLYDVTLDYICGLTAIRRPFPGTRPGPKIDPASLKSDPAK